MILALPWIPIFTALLLTLIPGSEKKLLRGLTLTSCTACFVITIVYLLRFDAGLDGFQFIHSLDWIPALGVKYQVGLDGINMTLCLLHALVSLAGAFTACWDKERLKEYLIFYLILTGAIYGVFTALDIFLLYLFYEMTLIPLYPMIGIWGSKNKEYGAMKLTIFITAGAVLALFGILLLYKELGLNSFDYIEIVGAGLASAQFGQAQGLALQPEFQKLVAPIFLVGFGVIASLWPLHSWSPIGYAAAPTSVSMLHAGVLKKMGPYLILRLAVALLPAGVQAWSGWLAVLGGIGILYAGYAAMRQQDLKFMIGFSSVSHMGYVLLGIAAMTPVSLSGTVLLMFSHGVMAAATFAVIGFLYEQTHVRGVGDFGGLVKRAPFIALCFILTALASLGLPGFSNFVSELLVFIGSWEKFPIIVAFAVFGVLITAIYLLRAVQSVCYGPQNPRLSQFKDVHGWANKFPFLLLIGALILFGVWPEGLLRMIRPAVEAMLQ